MTRVGLCGILLAVFLAAAGCGQTAATPAAAQRAVSQVPPISTKVASPQAAAEAASGIVEQMDLQRLATAADFILVASVTEIKSEWNTEQTRIHTDARLSVQQCLKGPSRPDQVTVRIPGGQVGEIVQSVSPVAEFQVGEDVVVFLEYGEQDAFRVVGAFQGKFTLENGTLLGTDVSAESFLNQIGEIIQQSGISRDACTAD